MEIIQAHKDRALSKSAQLGWTVPRAHVSGGPGDAFGFLVPVSSWGSGGAKEEDYGNHGYYGEGLTSSGCSDCSGVSCYEYGDGIWRFVDLVEFGRQW